MDLDALVTQQLNTQNKSATKDLLPQQQTNRSYPDTKVIPQSQVKLNLIPEIFSCIEKNNQWLMQYTLSWPGPPMPKNQRQATTQQLHNFANEFISMRSFPGEEKYYIIKFIDKEKMHIVFDAKKWLNDAYLSSRAQFTAPLSLVFKGRKALPTFVFASSQQIDFGKYLVEEWESYLKSKTTKLKHREFAFLKKVSVDLFDYSYSFRQNSFKATLKFSVVLASLAAYMIWKHKKDLSPADIKSLQRKASNMKDVKRLDKYIKRL